MGQITAFDVGKLVNEYKCTSYVETGTGIGVSLRHSMQFPFNKFYSVDLDKDLIESIKSDITDERVEFINDYSTNGLKNILPKIQEEESVLFFLDAHFPGADFHKMSYEESMIKYKHDSLPLDQEIQLIKNARSNKKDVIIVDDLHLYEPGEYQHSNWMHGQLQEQLGLKRSADFIYNLYKDTHNIIKYTAHQGYLLITPK